MAWEPKTLNPKGIVGYVWCEYLGILPCSSKSDKVEIEALCQLFLKGLDNGQITIPRGSFPQCKNFNSKECEAMRVLGDHVMKDVVANGNISGKLNKLLKAEGKSREKRLIYVEMDEIKRLLGG